MRLNISSVALTIVTFVIILAIGMVVTQNMEDTTARDVYVSTTVLADNDSIQTIPETTYAVSGINRTWLNFDGVNDYVNLSNSLKKSGLNETNVTISFWLNTSSPDSFYYLLILSSFNGGRNLIYVLNNYHLAQNEAKNLCVYFGGTEYHCSNETLPQNEWTNVIITINDTYFVNRILFDNVNVLNSSITDIGVSIPDSNLDKISSSSASIIGAIDEVRIYNRQLSQSEISEIYNSGRVQNSSLPSDGLVLWLPFNENTGTDLHSFNETDLT